MTEGNSYRNQTMSVASIDLMKLICSFMVVVIHYKPLLPYSTFLNVLTAEGICRIAVPFFFTVSGMLLCAKLSEQKISAENQRMICRKALESNIKLYLYWTAIYWVYYIPQWYINEEITWSNLIYQLRQALIDTGSCYHFWYMVSLIYAIPLMRRLSECSTKTLVRLVLVLWPVQCLRYSYRWLPGGDVLPWDSMYFDALMNTVFCAVPLLSLGILCYRYHTLYQSKRWALLLILFCTMDFIELLLIYAFTPYKNHFEFRLMLPAVSFCLVNFLLTMNGRFLNRGISLAMRRASVWIYCVHPIFIGLYSYMSDSLGIRRFAAVLFLCLVSSLIYVTLAKKSLLYVK